MSRRRMVAVAVALAAVVIPGSAALAVWRSTAPLVARAQADALAAVSKPTAEVVRGDSAEVRPVVVVTWSPSGLVGGTAVDDITYEVVRHGAVPDSGVAVVCAPSTLAARVDAPPVTTCTDAAVGDGTWTFTVTARFHDWHTAPSPASDAVTIDTTPPTVLAEITAGQLGNDPWYTGPVTVAAHATDDVSPAPVLSCSIAHDQRAPAPCVQIVPFDASYRVRLTADGRYDLTFTATDEAGNVSEPVTVHVDLDQTVPTPATLTAPAFAATSPVTLTVDTGDATSGVARVDWFVCAAVGCNPVAGAVPAGTGDESAPYSTEWLPVGPDGSYRFRARVVDVAGNVQLSNLRTMVVDTTNPTVVVSAPATGTVVGGTAVVFAADVTESGSGVANVRFDYRPIGQDAPWTELLDPPGPGTSGVRSVRNIGDATYELRAVARDRAGNETTSEPTTFRVRNLRAASVSLANQNGGVRGRLETGDRATFAFSQPVTPASVCTSWAGDTPGPTAVVARLADGGTNADRFVIESDDCAVGTVTLGSGGYVTGGDVTFAARLTWDPSAPANLMVEIGLPAVGSGSLGVVATVTSSVRGTYAPSITLRSVDGIVIDPVTTRTTTAIQF